MTEQQLIAKCIRKDERAMSELFDKYASVLKATCVRILKNREQAADIFQEGFIQIFKNLEKFEYKSSLYTWMNRIMINCCLLEIRKNKIIQTSLDIHENIFVEDDLSDMDECTEQYLFEMEAKEVLQMMMELPDKYRIVLTLFAIDGLKHNEISEKLGISEALSKKMVSRARIKLVELIKNKKNDTKRFGFVAQG